MQFNFCDWVKLFDCFDPVSTQGRIGLFIAAIYIYIYIFVRKCSYKFQKKTKHAAILDDCTRQIG